jgi:hypothetical protein
VDPLPLLILVNGALPGLGKSTLSRGLAARLRDGGLDVEEFEEQAILDRPEFAAAIGEWRSTSRVSFETLLVGTHAYLEACRRRRADVYVVDSLLPFLPSLFAWGCSDGEIRGFFSELRALMRGFEVLLLQLEGDATTGLQRAAGRELRGGSLDSSRRFTTMKTMAERPAISKASLRISNRQHPETASSCRERPGGCGSFKLSKTVNLSWTS